MNTNSGPKFEPVMETRLYQIPQASDNVGWCGYLLGRRETPTDTPIGVEESLKNLNGSYLFSLTPPALATADQVTAFIKAVRASLDSCFAKTGRFTGRACFWMVDPADPGKGVCSSRAFIFQQGLNNNFNTQSNFNNLMGDKITLSLQNGAYIKSYDEGLQLYGVGSDQVLSFPTKVPNKGPIVSPNQAYIPFVGPYSGCFVLAGTVDLSIMLPYFDEGVRYAHAGNGKPVQQTYPVINTGSGLSIKYVAAVDPLDATNSNPHTVDLAMGRLRTLFAPVSTNNGPDNGADNGTDDGTLSLPSLFRTRTNKAISLIPQKGGSPNSGPAIGAGSLVLGSSNPSSTELYMGLAGAFALAVAGAPRSGQGAGAVNDLLCGLFGTETMSFRAYATDDDYDCLRFFPNQPAYAPVFPVKEASLNDPNSGKIGQRLTDKSTTSWAMMVDGPSGAVSYSAQPEGSTLYHATGATEANGVSVLQPFNSNIRLSPSPKLGVPLVPYVGVKEEKPAQNGFDPANLGLFESQILSPTRQGLISQQAHARISAMKAARIEALRTKTEELTADTVLAGTISTTTPQGLLAMVTAGNAGTDYVKVILANNDPATGRAPEMAFLNLQTELQTLFQTNQLFAVVVNPKYLGKLAKDTNNPDPTKPLFENTVTITDWTMAAEVGKGVLATDYRNVMIFKFCDGTLQDRVKSPHKWVDTHNFSIADQVGDEGLALTGLSQWLQNVVAEGIDEAEVKKNTLYANFARIVQDPNWNGILVLRASVDPSGIPDQIKGLAAGIDLSLFEAHHFGVTVSRVKVNGSEISLDGPSSLFGLIDYQLPQFRQNVATGASPDLPLPLNTDGDYGFGVLQLQALFKNSALVDFRSRVQLTTNRLFGSQVSQTYSILGALSTNGVVLKGTYQKQGNSSTYIFEQDQMTVYQLASNVLQAVSFQRVQFNTLSSDTGGNDPQILSRFLIWGALDFAVLQDTQKERFDILSFGSPPGSTGHDLGKGLSFSNLQVNLSSPVATPATVTFSFDASKLAFDITSSTSREKSLFPTFALQVESFIASNGDKRPVDLDYLPVRMAVPLKALSGPWYGVSYKVTMGTPGALASNAGFESRMVLAWSPQTQPRESNYSVFAGLQLPGAAPGAKLLTLQGILKLSIDSIQLTYDPIQGSSPPVKAFNLRLNNIGLKFLGIAKLPPGATINFFLFGDPAGTGSLGWYAAYIQDQGKQSEMVALAPPLKQIDVQEGGTQ